VGRVTDVVVTREHTSAARARADACAWCAGTGIAASRAGFSLGEPRASAV
jgi:hypothetical protein